MPIDRMAERLKKEKEVQDYLQGFGTDTQGTRSRAYANREAALGGGLQDVLGRAASTYGLNPSVSAAGVASGAQVNENLRKDQDAQIEQRQYREKQALQTRLFNYARDRYTSAGYDLQTANAQARQFALDESNRQFEAGQAAKERNAKQERANIASDYAERGASIQPDTGNPYEQALYRSLLAWPGPTGPEWG